MTTVEKLRELLATWQDYREVEEERKISAMKGEYEPSHDAVQEQHAQRMIDLGVEVLGTFFDDVHRIADACEALTRKGTNP